ncbi:MAG TPA: PQQ-binding-like beta-propeller repeat protein [Phycisphaerae bacterium]|nr:PQQ-binding-like beta-propeller repeat protein [Phycisphaerae bacterium]
MRAFMLSVLISLIAFSAARAGGDANWPQFRGPGASGVSEGKPTPTSWDVESGENILWKTKTPGLGLSSPIVWGDRIFLTTAVKKDGGKQKLTVGLYGDIQPVKDDSPHEWKVLCVDKKNGKILWEQTATEGVPKIKRHTKASHANSTPATDGKHVVAFFGSEGLYCYDMEGKKLWSRDFGTLDSGYYQVPDAQWGFGSSPVIYDGKVVIQCDVEKGSFVAALNVDTGENVWMTERNEVPTWGSPTVHQFDGTTQVICNGYKQIGAYDLASGAEIWKLRGGGDIPVPTPVVAHDLIYITNGHGMEMPVYAIQPSAKGKLKFKKGENATEGIAYRLPMKGNYMQTPIVVGDYLYLCRDNGVVTCVEAKTGQQKYQQRLGNGSSGFTASAVCCNDKLYFTSEDGDIYVVQAGPEFKQIEKNSMGDVCMATPAISDGVIFFRTQKRLIAVGAK